MKNPNQDLIDGMDAAGARFTVSVNEPEAISEAIAGWLYLRGREPHASNINIEDDGNVFVGNVKLTDDELVSVVRFALAEHA